MSSGVVWILPGGELIIDIDSITLVNNTVKTHDITVPAGEQWLVINLKIANADDVNRAVNVRVYNEAAKTSLLANLSYEASVGASTGLLNWPNGDGTETNKGIISCYIPLILKSGNTISIEWAAGGASTGAVDADGVVLMYLKFPV